MATSCTLLWAPVKAVYPHGQCSHSLWHALCRLSGMDLAVLEARCSRPWSQTTSLSPSAQQVHALCTAPAQPGAQPGAPADKSKSPYLGEHSPATHSGPHLPPSLMNSHSPPACSCKIHTLPSTWATFLKLRASFLLADTKPSEAD